MFKVESSKNNTFDFYRKETKKTMIYKSNTYKQNKTLSRF